MVEDQRCSNSKRRMDRNQVFAGWQPQAGGNLKTVGAKKQASADTLTHHHHPADHRRVRRQLSWHMRLPLQHGSQRPKMWQPKCVFKARRLCPSLFRTGCYEIDDRSLSLTYCKRSQRCPPLTLELAASLVSRLSPGLSARGMASTDIRLRQKACGRSQPEDRQHLPANRISAPAPGNGYARTGRA